METYVTSSDSVKAGSLEGGLQVSYSSISPGPGYKGCCSQHGVLPSGSRRQLRTTAIVGIAWGNLLENPRQHMKGDFLCLALGFLLDGLWLLGELWRDSRVKVPSLCFPISSSLQKCLLFSLEVILFPHNLFLFSQKNSSLCLQKKSHERTENKIQEQSSPETGPASSFRWDFQPLH